MSAFLGAMGGLGQGLSQVGQAGFNDALMSRRMEAIEQMRQKREDQVYQRNRADSQWDLTEQRTYNDWQAEDERVRTAEAAKQARTNALEDYESKKVVDQKYEKPTKGKEITDQDGRVYTYDANGNAAPVTRQLSQDEMRTRQALQDQSLANEVNANEPPNGLLAREMNRGQVMPAGNSPEQMQSFREGLDQRGWYDVKSPQVSDREQISKRPVGDLSENQVRLMYSQLVREIKDMKDDLPRNPSPEQLAAIQTLESEAATLRNQLGSRFGFSSGQAASTTANDPLDLGL